MLRIVLALALLAPAACANRAKQSVSLYESGDYAGAMRAADEGLARHPDDDALWAMKVRAALALGDGDGVARAYADYVARRGDDDQELLRDLAVATLAQALASPSAKLKMTAIEAVAQAELHELTDPVAERMGDDDDRVAATAAIAVLKGIPGAPHVADDLLRSDNADARRIVVDGIGRKVGKLALADLQKAANDSDPRVRRVAIRWLGQLQDTDSVEVLTKHLRDPDATVRAASAVALARIGVGNLEALGTQALSDRALAVRLGGVELMAAARREDRLIALVDDADPMVALHAAIAVKAARPDLAPKAIDRAIAAGEWTVRAGAANMLVVALGKAAALPVAMRMAADRDAGVRLAAARVIAQYGDRQAAQAIFMAALTDHEHGVQAAADLARLGDPAGIEALGARARDAARSPEQRTLAIAAHRSAHRVTPGLVGALADNSGLVRVEAAAVIGLLAKSRS